MSTEINKQESNTMEEKYDEGMLCAQCHNESPMYPRKNSQEDCNIYCADCYWDLDAERKRKRRSYWKKNPEFFEAYRKNAAEVLGITYVPLPKEEQ